MWSFQVNGGRQCIVRGPDELLITGQPIGHTVIQGDILRATQAFKVPALLRSIVHRYSVKSQRPLAGRWQIVELRGGPSRLKLKFDLPRGATRLPPAFLKALRNVFQWHIGPDAAPPADVVLERQEAAERRKLDAVAQARAALIAARRSSAKEATP